MSFMVTIIMSGYYTKERHNACIALLTDNALTQAWYQRRYETCGLLAQVLAAQQ